MNIEINRDEFVLIVEALQHKVKQVVAHRKKKKLSVDADEVLEDLIEMYDCLLQKMILCTIPDGALMN